MGELNPPSPLHRQHDTASFSSGNPSLDSWLDKIALQAGYSQTSRTFVLLDPQSPNKVIAYYSMASASLATEDALDRINSGAGSTPIPCVVLARLAIDKNWQAKGLGKLLVRDAIQRIRRLQKELGIRALLIHAIDDQAINFYQHLGFKASSFNPRLLMALLKDFD